jgi:ribokinase
VSERFDVRVVGSANLDIVVTTARHPLPGETVHGEQYHEYPGGKGLNQAVSAARSGARVAFVGAVGGDAAGDRLVEVLLTDGIDASDVRRVNGATGRAVIVVDEHGENTIVVVPAANAEVAFGPTGSAASVVLAQLEIPMATVAAALAAARSDGATTVLNPSPATSIATEVLELCDVIVPNEHEVALLGGVDVLLASGCGAVVVTLGGNGVDIHTSGGVEHLPAYRVEVVDTTGAGDAFCGALASRLAAGDPLAVAVRWASAAGALATTRFGAVPAQPTAAAISALLVDQPQT